MMYRRITLKELNKMVKMNRLEKRKKEIWDPKKGPFSEVVDGNLQRTEAGKRALREELQLYTDHSI